MPVELVRIATRKSPLALWQAEHVRTALMQHYPGLAVELVAMTTRGDRLLDIPLSAEGGKGLFIKELEESLLDGRADIAVHSMKDVTVEMPVGLALQVILPRADPRDVLVANQHYQLVTLPAGARVGTSSLRRQCQLRATRPDLQVIQLRGNVGTRLRKLDRGEFDAIILAAAGLTRLGFKERISSYLEMSVMLPAIGQGAIGLQTRADDRALLELLTPLNDRTTEIQLQAERSFSRRLYGGCQLPIAAHAMIDEADLTLHGMVGAADGSTIIRDKINGRAVDADRLGRQLAEQLLARGADAILRAVLGG